jgi:hypothetical protein
MHAKCAVRDGSFSPLLSDAGRSAKAVNESVGPMKEQACADEREIAGFHGEVLRM